MLDVSPTVRPGHFVLVTMSAHIHVCWTYRVAGAVMNRAETIVGSVNDGCQEIASGGSAVSADVTSHSAAGSYIREVHNSALQLRLAPNASG